MKVNVKETIPWSQLAATAGFALLFHGGREVIGDVPLVSADHGDNFYAQMMSPSNNGDAFYNWDFNNTFTNPSGLNNASENWPVSIIFYNGASIDLIKETYDDSLDNYTLGSWHIPVPLYPDPYCGEPEYAGLDLALQGQYPDQQYGDYEPFHFDEDRGVKGPEQTPYGCGTMNYQQINHLRLYADPPDLYPNHPDVQGPNSPADSIWNWTYGHMVIGTAHIDHNENCGNLPPFVCTDEQWSGESEAAEGNLLNDFYDAWIQRSGHPPTIVHDTLLLLPPADWNEPDGGHYVWTDGKVSYARLEWS